MAEYVKNLPRDVFLYLLSIITLVASAVSFGTLVFQYINIYFPDVLSDFYSGSSAYLANVRQSLAFLIVIFPVYIWVARFLRKDIELNPEKRELKIRKWLMYLTVFAAGLVIIGDLVALLNTFLEGEITARFILKVLTVFFIAGSVFYYYFTELRQGANGEKKWEALGIRAFPWAIILTTVVAVVFGFFVAGSPTARRTVRFDERRVNDLSVIQSQVINYWQNKGELPKNLSDLPSDILGIVVPVDPKTSESYEYRPLTDLKFELCAVFEIEVRETIDSYRTPMPASIDSMAKNSVWNHGIGRTCFERTIDPDFFKLEKSIER